MTIATPELPYSNNAIAPYISEETLNFHFGKHHMGYFKKLTTAINVTFGSFECFKAQCSAAAGQIGSGWAWLVKDAEGKLSINTTGNAGAPFTEGLTPVLTGDIWEYAYYVDDRNDRGGYVKVWWSLVNLNFANANL